jgi:hypothetical protein
MLKQLLTLFFVSTLFGPIVAQQADFPILLKNETVRPGDLEQKAPRAYADHYYVVVQHAQLRLQSDFYGFETFEYLPKRSAFARVPVNRYAEAKARLEAAGGRVITMRDRWKLGPRMYSQNYPEWAWLGGQKMKVWLRYWPQLSPVQIETKLAQAGENIIDRKPAEKLVALALDPERTAQVAALPFVYYVQAMEDPGEPENFHGRVNHRITPMHDELGYDGSGIMIGHNDAGLLGEHMDYKGRLQQVGSSSSSSTHGDHTAGTIFGAGNINPDAEGMAPGAEMYYTLYPGNLNNADNIYTTQNARLTSNSFSNGCNAGYTNFTRQMDQDAFDNPNMLHVFSAGNNGTSDCGYGAGSGWGNVTGGHKIAKNVIATANLVRNDNLAGSSSRGPASDGRIKPDISAVGTQVLSTVDDPADNSYDRFTGTSMACPGITGALAVLMEAFKDHHNGQEPNGTLLKGMLLNGADDLGRAGPDFFYGYGRVNTRKAYQMVAQSQYFQDSLTGSADSSQFSINVPAGTKELKVMLIWADPAASTAASRALVNDLDLTLSDGTNSYQPWVLNPYPDADSLDDPATRSRDSLNNIEQITLQNPSAGTYTASVEAFNLPQGPQSFYLVYYREDDDIHITYPQKGDGLGTGTNQITWDSPRGSGTETVEYSRNGGSSWIAVGTNNNDYNTESWFVPNNPSDEVYVRVRSSNDTDVVGPLTVVQTPGNVQVVRSCPDSVALTWGTVNGASGYVVYQLGNKYMDSLAYVKEDTAVLAHDAGQEDWYAVAAVVNDTSVGYRSLATQKEAGINNCQVARDLVIEEVLSPGNGALPSCLVGTDVPVTVRVRNVGTQPLTGFDLSYVQRNQAPITEAVGQSLAPGQHLDYTFQSGRATMVLNFRYPFKFWVASNSPDQNPYNDTLEIGSVIYSSTGSLATVGDTADFENFSTCATSSDCGFTNCPLQDGWHNAVNFTSDDIDFRVNTGGTPSTGTGPITDHTTGTTVGRYLYTEASGGCDSSTAMLYTPCLDLSGSYRPSASIWYHMRSSQNVIGKLMVDIYDGERWHLNVNGSIAGAQGSYWQELVTPLDSFATDTIVIRYRGKTGSDYQSDIALDDWSLNETSQTSLAEAARKALRIYPNPSKGLFYLQRGALLEGPTQLVVRSASGQRIQAKQWSGEEKRHELDLSHLPAGVYMLEIRAPEQQHTYRLVLQ